MNTRRSFLQGSLAVGVGAAANRSAWSAPAPFGLKDMVGHSGRLIGAVLDRWQMEDATMLAVIVKNFNLVTLGRLKWGFLRPSPTGFDFAESDWMADACKKNHLTMHGHNLCWNTSNPAWLTKTMNSGNAQKILTDHIHTVVGRYAGRITSWDVVNEPIAAWMGRSDGLYKGPWLDALGESYIDIAFRATADADPAALRVLNVAHLEQGGKGSDQARQYTLALVQRLLQRGVPIQAVGFESHLPANYPITSTPSREQFLAQLKSLGIKVIVTELDVDDTKVSGDIAARDAAVAQTFGTYLNDILRQAQPSRVIFFSPMDKGNWYDALASSARSDGQPHRPGLFDLRMAEKPSYNAVANALKANG